MNKSKKLVDLDRVYIYVMEDVSMLFMRKNEQNDNNSYIHNHQQDMGGYRRYGRSPITVVSPLLYIRYFHM